jgi:TMEM175 potassium channel family protein
MTKQRLEAFSDGVIAIIITIMVLELRIPHGDDWHALESMIPRFLSYVLSFVFLGIYWSNHHHLCHLVTHVNGRILWANLHLLFWLSLVPVATGWIGEHVAQPLPTAAYGVVLIMCAVAWTILQATIVKHQGPESVLAAAVGGDAKGKISLAAYAAAIPLAFVNPWISVALYALVAAMWLVPDRRIESTLHH